MEKAKEEVKSIQDARIEDSDYHPKDNGGAIKPEINNLLHMYLPEDVTIGEAEDLSIVILEMIQNPYHFVRDGKNEATQNQENKRE